MTNNVMLGQMALSLVGSWGQYQSASIQADLQQSIQNYRNSMSQLSAARSMNATVVNEVRATDAYVLNDQAIQKQSMQDQSRLEVEAAAAGVTGKSVELAARDLRASAGRARYAQKRQYKQSMSDIEEQRTSIAIGAITNQDIQVIPKPSIASMLLGAGTNLLSVYDSHQPEGSRLLGYNGGNVNDKTHL